MTEAKPCAQFVTPKPEQKYGAFCGRCHFSRQAHEEWENWDRKDASLGVGHIWTNTDCPAYRTMDPADCDCRTKT